MGLIVTRLVLRDFRSYPEFVVEPDSRLTVLVGSNAAGKTNIIEAMQLVTAGDSFRRPQWSELIRWGSREASVTLSAEGDGRVLETVLTVGDAGRRVYRVNGKIRRRVSEIAGIIPCVSFTPDDLRMVKDSADKRRGAIDGVGDQLSPAYLSARAEYERIVRQRNALLKNTQRNLEVLDALTDRLVIKGIAFMGHRRRLFERIAGKMSEVYETLAPGEHLTAQYVPSWSRADQSQAGSGDPLDSMRAALRKAEVDEKARGVSLVGPHRDEVIFSVNGREARTFASQGQMRTIALAWKLAEVGVITEVAGQPPVLLLDDVMSELDERRRHALTSFVGEAAQTFVTTTNLGYFENELTARAKVVNLP